MFRWCGIKDLTKDPIICWGDFTLNTQHWFNCRTTSVISKISNIKKNIKKGDTLSLNIGVSRKEGRKKNNVLSVNIQEGKEKKEGSKEGKKKRRKGRKKGRKEGRKKEINK